MVERSADEIEQLLDRGEWLTGGHVAVLFGVSRSTVHRWLTSGRVGYRETPGGLRRCDPADVKRLLAEWRQVRRGPQ